MEQKISHIFAGCGISQMPRKMKYLKGGNRMSLSHEQLLMQGSLYYVESLDEYEI